MLGRQIGESKASADALQSTRRARGDATTQEVLCNPLRHVRLSGSLMRCPARANHGSLFAGESKSKPNASRAWRVHERERTKTVGAALVLCLNVGVDPPDSVKPAECGRVECWFDTMSTTPKKACKMVGACLQGNYERWQSKAYYKVSLDPTMEEIQSLCENMRRKAGSDRVLFHYNGHGVPKPTAGEIWVYNKGYTQYIPLLLYDLQTWMGPNEPSLYLFGGRLPPLHAWRPAPAPAR
jgi:regulator-associated protein of mTOR